MRSTNMATTTTTTAGSSIAAPPPPLPTAGVPELRMLKLLDRASGVCLFTEQWKWNPHAHAEGVDALVQSFTQFAREIDGGEVMQVHFNPSTGKNEPKFADDRRPSSGPMQFMSTAGAITMISTQTETVQAVLFHDRTLSEPLAAAFKTFLQRLVVAFDQSFRDDLARVQAQLQPHAALRDEQHAQVVAPFRAFQTELNARLVPELEAAIPKQ